jgi:hypothetical protein
MSLILLLVLLVVSCLERIYSRKAGGLVCLAPHIHAITLRSVPHVSHHTLIRALQISGLWIVSGSIAGFGLLCCVWAFYHHHVHKPRRKRSAMLEALKKHKWVLRDVH